MENYKETWVSTWHNPETFEKREVETKIPAHMVEEIKKTLDGMDGYLITPPIINEKDLSVVFGVMDMSDENYRMKYKVNITPSN